MQNLLLLVDKISTWIGQFFSWLIVALTLMIAWEVFSRYALDNPHPWAFDVMSMMYGTLFMMAGGLVSLSDRRLRVGAPSRKAKAAKVAQPGMEPAE